MDEDSFIAIETEALTHTYGDDLQVSCGPDGGQCTGITLQLFPRGTEQEWERFVEASLRFSVAPSYPESLPGLELVDVKGLTDEQQAQCLARLQQEAEGLQGEMMLGHLCETALDWVTGANHPPADPCVFCLEQMVAGGGEGAQLCPAYAVVKLACFHCFHMPCFGPWWAWQQRQLAAREAQLTAEYKSIAVQKLREEQIERDEQGAYTVRCPSCRAAVTPASLAHAWSALQACTADSWTQGQGHQMAALDPGAAQRLAALQRQQRAGLARQQRAGGLIDSSKGVAVSLAELQLRASDSSRQLSEMAGEAGQEGRSAVGGPAVGGDSGDGLGRASGQQGLRAGAHSRGAGGGRGRQRSGGRGRHAEATTTQQQQPRQGPPGLSALPQQAQEQGQQQEGAVGRSGGARGRGRHGPGGPGRGCGGQAGGPAGRLKDPSTAAPQTSTPTNAANGSAATGRGQNATAPAAASASMAAAAAAAAAAALHREPNGAMPAAANRSSGDKRRGAGPPPGFELKEAVPRHLGARGRDRMPLQQPRGPSS